MKLASSYVRDESKLHNTPAWVIFTMPLVTLLLVISLVFLVISLVNRNYVSSAISAILLALSSTWGIFTEYYYNFYESCKLTFRGNYIECNFNLNQSVINSSNRTTTIKIWKINKFKLKGKRKIVIYGKITKKAPLQNERKLNKIELPMDFIERNEVIDKINNFKSGDAK